MLKIDISPEKKKSMRIDKVIWLNRVDPVL
jgi:hypothetical protein